MPKSLAELFAEPEELEVAQRILAAVPEDIGKYPFADACLSGIVFDAYRERLRGQSLEEFRCFVRSKKEYCNERGIMDKLRDAGYVKRNGFLIDEPLWVRAGADEGV